MPKFIVESVAEGLITLRAPGSNYRNSFLFNGDPTSLSAGQRVGGAILAPAWKVDNVDLGGNYVEPLYGRPRRMQGAILSINPTANELTVQVGYEDMKARKVTFPQAGHLKKAGVGPLKVLKEFRCEGAALQIHRQARPLLLLF